MQPEITYLASTPNMFHLCTKDSKLNKSQSTSLLTIHKVKIVLCCNKVFRNNRKSVTCNGTKSSNL